jgi:hypothetical protein
MSTLFNQVVPTTVSVYDIALRIQKEAEDRALKSPRPVRTDCSLLCFIFWSH